MKKTTTRGRVKVSTFIHTRDSAQAEIDVRAHERAVHETGATSNGFGILDIKAAGLEITLAFPVDRLRKLRNEIDNAIGVAELSKPCAMQHCQECRTGIFHPEYNKPKPPAPAVEAPPIHFTTEPTK